MSCLHNVLENSFMISSNDLFKNITIQQYNYAQYMGYRSSSQSPTCYSQILIPFNY